MARNISTRNGHFNATMGYIGTILKDEPLECVKRVVGHSQYKIAREYYQDIVMTQTRDMADTAGRALWNMVNRLREEFYAKEPVNG